jgi:hypothetical protein
MDVDGSGGRCMMKDGWKWCLLRGEGNDLSNWSLLVRSSCLGYRSKGYVAMGGIGKSDE